MQTNSSISKEAKMNLDTITERFEQRQPAYDSKNEKLYPFDVVMYSAGYSRTISIGAVEDIVFRGDEAYVKICGNPDYQRSSYLLKIKDDFFQEVENCKEAAKVALMEKRNLKYYPFYLTGFWAIGKKPSGYFIQEKFGIFQIRLDVQLTNPENIRKENSTEFTREFAENADSALIKWLKDFNKIHPDLEIRFLFPTNGHSKGFFNLKSNWMDLNENSSSKINIDNNVNFIRGWIFTADNKPFKKENVFIEMLSLHSNNYSEAYDKAYENAQAKSKLKIYDDKFSFAYLDEDFNNPELIICPRIKWSDENSGWGRINPILCRLAYCIDKGYEKKFIKNESGIPSKNEYKYMTSAFNKLAKYTNSRV